MLLLGVCAAGTSKPMDGVECSTLLLKFFAGWAVDEIVVVFVALLVWTERVCVVRVSLVLVSA